MVLNITELCSSEFTEKEFIEFLRRQGITVKTNTKARGNLGICLKNRIDISRVAAKDRRIAILAHEYAHKVHYDLEKEAFNKGGSLEKIFDTVDIKEIQTELIRVTGFVDKNSEFAKFYLRKLEIKAELKELEKIVRRDYPDFKRSQPFKPINSYFRKNKSPAKYLLKYDNVKIIQPVFKKENLYSIKNLDIEFPEIPESLRAYIKLNGIKREYNRLYRRKNKADKYYKKPTELFARFVEGIFTDHKQVQELAPVAYSRFTELLNQGYYGSLKELLILARLNDINPAQIPESQQANDYLAKASTNLLKALS